MKPTNWILREGVLEKRSGFLVAHIEYPFEPYPYLRIYAYGILIHDCVGGGDNLRQFKFLATLRMKDILKAFEAHATTEAKDSR